MMHYRVGLGQDLHRLVEGRPFVLAGLEIPASKGELAHSDGDVLAHAVCDALLGASGLGDIGQLYPPSDPKYKDADSMLLLGDVWNLVRKAGWHLVNLDAVIICEKPKILEYRDKIRANLATCLNVDIDQVFLKAKTNEGCDEIGRQGAVAANVVCLLSRA